MSTNLGKQIPGWAQGVIAVVVTAGAALVIYEIWKGIKKKKQNRGSEAENVANANELAMLNANPATRQTITPDQAAAMANQLFTAMDGYGTDFKVIFNVFSQLKNDADFLAISTAFGTREISSGKLNPEPNLTGTLVAALDNELGDNITSLGWLVPLYGAYQIAATDDQPTVLNKILEKKNIKYRI